MASDRFPLKKGDFPPEVVYFWPYSSKSLTYGERIAWCAVMAEADSHKSEYAFDWFQLTTTAGAPWYCNMFDKDMSQYLDGIPDIDLGIRGLESPVVRVVQAQLIAGLMSAEPATLER